MFADAADAAASSSSRVDDTAVVSSSVHARQQKKIKKKFMKVHKLARRLARKKTLSTNIIVALRKGLEESTRSIRDLAAFVEQEVGISLQRNRYKIFFHKMLQKLLLQSRKKQRCKKQQGPELVVSNDPGLVSERKEKLLMFAADDWPLKHYKLQLRDDQS